MRAALRSRGEPVTLFGEREMERRERLRLLLASMDAADGGELQAPADAEVLTGAPPKAELFYTEGSDALLQARLLLAKSSLAAAAARLGAEHERWEAGLPPAAVDAGLALASRVAALQVDCSQVADGRPLSALALSPGGDALLSGGWSGTVSLWRALTRGCERALTVRGYASLPAAHTLSGRCGRTRSASRASPGTPLLTRLLRERSRSPPPPATRWRSCGAPTVRALCRLHMLLLALWR